VNRLASENLSNIKPEPAERRVSASGLAYGGDGGDDGVRRLWSLLDIMNEFDLGSLADIFERMSRLEFEYSNYDNLATIGGRSEADEDEIKWALSAITEALKFCEVHDFDHAHEVISRIVNGWEYNKRDLSAIATELRHARESIGDELQKRMFIMVDKGRAPCPGSTELLGYEVVKAFPHAIEDIMEASNCLIADCNTAAVFHLMRIVEWGLRALCVDLGLRRATKRTKSGKKKFTPISYTDWETMLNQLQEKVDKKIEKMARGQRKQAAQEFYYPVLQDIRGIRDAWRNHVMHTRATYIREEADAVLAHVKRLMNLLAIRLKPKVNL
jgi:hypothetical protein